MLSETERRVRREQAALMMMQGLISHSGLPQTSKTVQQVIELTDELLSELTVTFLANETAVEDILTGEE